MIEIFDSSSSEQGEIVTGLMTGPAAVRVELSVSEGSLHVSTEVPGEKTVRLFDMQGHLLYAESFAGSGTAMRLDGLGRGAFVVRLSVGRQILATRKIRN